MYDRNEFKEEFQPFYENLNEHDINDDQSFPILKTFSKDQLTVLYKSGIITEEKFNSLIPSNPISNQSNKNIQERNPITNNVKEIITGDKLDELQELIKEKILRLSIQLLHHLRKLRKWQFRLFNTV